MKCHIKVIRLAALAFVCAFILLPRLCTGQVDSLKRVLATGVADSTRIKVLNQLGAELMYDQPDTSILLGKQALRLCQNLSSDRHLGTTLAFLGTYFDLKGEFDSALYYYFKSLPIREKRKDNKGVAAIFNNIGIVYMERADYPMALEYYAKAIALHERMGNRGQVSDCYNNIANVYLKLSDYPRALENYFKSKLIVEELGDREGLADLNLNLGVVYKQQGNLDKAIEYYTAAMKLDEELGSQYALASDYNNLSIAYGDRNEYGKAMEFALKALRMNRLIGNQMEIAEGFNNLGTLYKKVWSVGGEDKTIGGWAKSSPNLLLDSAYEYHQRAFIINKSLGIQEAMTTNLIGMGNVLTEQGKYPEAIKCFKQSLVIAREISAKLREYDAHQSLAHLYERWAAATEDSRRKAQYLDLSLTNLVRYMEIKDGVLNEEKQKEIGKLESRHEFEIAAMRKKQEELEQDRLASAALSRRNTLQYSAILIGLCALFGGVFFLGRLRLPKWAVELTVFVPFLILFEFLGVLFDPYGERWTGGAPGYKLLINALMAGLIFPVHSFFEQMMKRKLFRATATE